MLNKIQIPKSTWSAIINSAALTNFLNPGVLNEEIRHVILTRSSLFFIDQVTVS